MVGQGYDGAAAISGHINGVKKHIREQCPSAVYVHCAPYSLYLYLCLLKAGQVPNIRKAVTVMHELAVFHCGSNKRLLHFQECIQEEFPELAHTRMKMHCTTRWLERQEAVRICDWLVTVFKSGYANTVVTSMHTSHSYFIKETKNRK